MIAAGYDVMLASSVDVPAIYISRLPNNQTLKTAMPTSSAVSISSRHRLLGFNTTETANAVRTPTVISAAATYRGLRGRAVPIRLHQDAMLKPSWCSAELGVGTAARTVGSITVSEKVHRNLYSRTIYLSR